MINSDKNIASSCFEVSNETKLSDGWEFIMENIIQLEDIAKKVRQQIFCLNSKNGSGHYASSLSCVEILVSLYFGGILQYDPNNMDAIDRDRFIMSKGQGATALYAILHYANVFGESILKSYCTPESKLGGLVSEYLPYGLECSTGSLGHGLGFAGGVALNAKLQNHSFRTYVLMGDGECQEGTVWEAALSIAHFKLNNLIAIIDYNGLQASERTENIIKLDSISEKWKAFGWDVLEVDGHDIHALISALMQAKSSIEKPCIIIAKTVKGKGITFMENSVDWHCRAMTEEELRISREDLDLAKC